MSLNLWILWTGDYSKLVNILSLFWTDEYSDLTKLSTPFLFCHRHCENDSNRVATGHFIIVQAEACFASITLYSLRNSEANILACFWSYWKPAFCWLHPCNAQTQTPQILFYILFSFFTDHIEKGDFIPFKFKQTTQYWIAYLPPWNLLLKWENLQ